MTAAGPAPLQTIATPRDERRPSVFISYFHGDKEFAKRLVDDLRTSGHACWVDTSAIKGGDEWIMTIAEGIINSYAVVVIVTREALRSRWVQDEILWARTKDKPIVPLILEDVQNDTRFFPLVSYQGVALFDSGSGYDTALLKLLDSLPSPGLHILPELEAEDTAPEIPALPASLNRPSGARRKREVAYLERLKLEVLLDAGKYTPMTGTSQQKQNRAKMRSVFKLLPMNKERKEVRETRRFENAVEEIRRIRRVVLLGEPGGGKTTTIWKLAAELSDAALQDREAPIPLLIRLGKWTDAGQSLAAFIASQLGDLGSDLDSLLAEKRAALLLDGLNELPADQRAAKYPQVQRLIEMHQALLAVVSCRELDYTLDLGFDSIHIMPLDPVRIREFAERYLGVEEGEKLFWRIAGGGDVRALWDVWQKAGASFELFWTAPEIPRENPDVFGATTGQQDGTWREKVRGTHTMMELARSPYMLLMLVSVYVEQGELPENRGGLFRLFVETLLDRERIPIDERTSLMDLLAKTAYEMQIRRAEGDHGGALTVLPKDQVHAILGAPLLYLAASAGILNAGEQVRFTHQLLQEYFAARYMDIEFRAGRLEAARIWPPERWWQRTNWEEAAILLAGLYTDDCSPVVEWVAQANPEVAAMCAVRSGAGLAEATRARLSAQWLPRLTDLKRDPQPGARAAVGRALGLIRCDNRKGVGNVEVSTSGGGRIALPGIDWVEIPGGKFQYGHKGELNHPPKTLMLPAFHIGRYPVTYTQFQSFLDDPEGCANPRWFEGLTANDNRRIEEQWFKIANHPRENVNWYQAMAFCRWFSWRLGGACGLDDVAGWAVRLPTEFEWEKAARGGDGRIYPYKGKFDATKGNTDDTGIGQTCAVGIFPNGASPYGVQDMSGNVWEWCLSSYENPERDAKRENVRTDESRVLRGGSWFGFRGLARAVFRGYDRPSSRGDDVGFRVVCVVRPPSL